MIQAILKRVFHLPQMIVLLSLLALACLPLALSNLVRDAGVSLLLPITLIGAMLTWALVTGQIRKLSSGIILLVLGPLGLFVRIGQLTRPLFEMVKQSFNLIPAIINWSFSQTRFDLTPFLSAREELTQRALAFGGRLSLWLNGLLHGIQIEDPVVRTLIWSLAVWSVAVWAGWQIYRNKRLLAGMLPSTVVLAFILDYTGKQTQILWLHLALLLFLYGLISYANLLTRWKSLHTDYADSTGVDTLAFVGALSMGLVAVSFLSSTISLKDILDDLRDRSRASSESQAESLGLESARDNLRIAGFDGGLPRLYLISAGPELSRQLAMTISTGDLPPMPEIVRPSVPRYYWRTLTFQIYTGSGWTNPSAISEQVPLDQALFQQPPANYRIVNQEVTFPRNAAGRLYWAGTLLRADVPFQAAWIRRAENDAVLESDLLAALANVETYHAQSLVLNVSADELRASPSVYPDWVRVRYLVLPESVPERVRALARDLTASERSAYDRAIVIQNYLREFPYTLDVGSPPAGRDVADYFLFDLKQGYCDYYATSMVVLARAAGLPARLVVGYANGFYEPEQARYTVTENYAHSWVEIYFANIGWVEFEPTAGQSPIIYAEAGEAETAAQAFEPVQPLNQRMAVFFQRLNLWIPAFLLIGLILLWLGWDWLRFIRLDPSQAVQHLYRRLRRLARPVSGLVSKNQTAHQYALALTSRLAALTTRPRLQNWLTPCGMEIDQLTELYSRSLFAPRAASPSRAEARGAARVWSRLRWRLIIASVIALRRA